MRKYFDILKTTRLFSDIESGELETMLKCLGAEIKAVDRDEILLLAGDKPRHIGILLTGRLNILWEDYDGNRSLMAAVTSGGIFAEALCCAGVTESPVTVLAEAYSTVMLLGFSRILHTCPSSCSYHIKLIENMLSILADKNLRMQSRMEIVGLKSLRAKVLRYLKSFGYERGQNIVIPFNREELADFLCVDRSALSHELARMKKDGLIDYKKNNFVIF
ncbi:MAG TPA: Crp/Fnr family transcriptional regulator [Ruminococcaceae bacterium]|nr:Crp/Fnr family transcriptional regulator [Oscillospiraceae bacterium]